MDEKLEVIKGTLEAKGIKFIRLLWCDTANIIRAKAFHLNSFNTRTQNSINLAPATFAFTALGDSIAPGSGLQSIGEVWLEPDWDTLKFPYYVDTHACVLSHIKDHGEPYSLYGRVFLEKMLTKLYQLYGLTLQAAFGNEFYLLAQSDQGIKIKDDAPYASSSALNTHIAFIDTLADNFFAQNIKVRHLYAGPGPGQLKISIDHTDPLMAADQQIMLRETVRAVAKQYEHIASFLPKIFTNRAGSAAPIYFSLWENDLNVTGVNSPSRLSEITEYFIAGILYHLPALMAVTTPTTNSFRRIIPQTGAGAFAVWGHNNHEAAVCVPSVQFSPYPVSIQFKTCDASANPYLALGCMIAAGLSGIKEKFPLDPEMTVDPSTLTESEFEEKGIRPLHTDLWSALEDFRHNDTLKEAMGEKLAKVYLAVKRQEWEELESASLEEEVKLFLERY